MTNSTSPSRGAKIPPRSPARARPALPPPPPPPVSPSSPQCRAPPHAPDPGQLPCRRHLAAYAARVSSWVASTGSALGLGRPTQAPDRRRIAAYAAKVSSSGPTRGHAGRRPLRAVGHPYGHGADRVAERGLCSALGVGIQRKLQDSTVVPPVRCNPPRSPSNHRQKVHLPGSPTTSPGSPVEPAYPNTTSHHPTQGQLSGRRHFAAYAARVSSGVAGTRSGLSGLSAPVAGPNIAAAGGRVRRARTLLVAPGHWGRHKASFLSPTPRSVRRKGQL